MFFLIKGLISLFAPTLMMRSLIMATASACGFAGLMVRTLALIRTKSAIIGVTPVVIVCKDYLSLSLREKSLSELENLIFLCSLIFLEDNKKTLHRHKINRRV